MVTPASLKLGFLVGLGIALAGRWMNSWVGALAILCGVGVMLYAKRQTTSQMKLDGDSPLGLHQ